MNIWWQQENLLVAVSSKLRRHTVADSNFKSHVLSTAGFGHFDDDAISFVNRPVDVSAIKDQRSLNWAGLRGSQNVDISVNNIIMMLSLYFFRKLK